MGMPGQDENDHRSFSLDAIDDPVVVVDDDLRISYVNDAAASLFEAPPADLTDAPLETTWAAKPLQRAIRDAIETGEPAVETTTAGSIHRVRIYPQESTATLLFENETTRQTDRDVQQYEQILDRLADGVVLIDTGGRFKMVNDTFCDLVGRRRDELVGEPASTVTTCENVERATERYERLAAGERSRATFESFVFDQTGDTIPVEVHLSILNRDDPSEELLAVIRDISDRKADQRALESQRGELERLAKVNLLVNDIVQRLVDASTRDEIMSAICTPIGDSDLYEFVWIGHAGTENEPSTDAAIGNGRELGPGILTEHMDDADRTTLETGNTVVLDHGSTEESETATCKRLQESDVELAVTIPLQYGTANYGIMIVGAASTQSFNDRELGALELLGTAVGFSINAIKTRRLAHADTVVDLEFTLTANPIVDVAKATGASLELQGVVPAPGGNLVSYFQVHGCDPETVVDELESKGVPDSQVLESTTDGGLVELPVPEWSPIRPLWEHAAEIRGVTVEDDVAHLHVRVPHEHASETVEDVLERFPSLELRSKREQTVDPGSFRERKHALLDQLTDRQQSVLETAFHAGYFEWPRVSNAEEVAETLDIASSTLHQHLRKAQQQLFAELFEDDDHER